MGPKKRARVDAFFVLRRDFLAELRSVQSRAHSAIQMAESGARSCSGGGSSTTTIRNRGLAVMTSTRGRGSKATVNGRIKGLASFSTRGRMNTACRPGLTLAADYMKMKNNEKRRSLPWMKLVDPFRLFYFWPA